jgi:hypothetical protein
MEKEIEYINSEIERLEYHIANPIEYNITPTIKVKINDSTCYEYELKILNNIKQALTTKSKKEQAFDIAVAKRVDMYRLAVNDNVVSYNKWTEFDEYWLTEEEYNLIKEVLKND